MVSLNQAAKQLNNSKSSRSPTPIGQAGFDNHRENIDPHIKTQIVNAHRIITQKIWHAYGGFQDKAEELTIANKNEWTFLTNATNDLFTGVHSNGITLTGDIITMEHAGHYYGQVCLTLTGDNAVDFQVRVYNITQSKQMGYKLGVTTKGAGNFSGVCLPLYFEDINAGDQLRMEIQNITSDKNPTFKNGIFWINYLHE